MSTQPDPKLQQAGIDDVPAILASLEQAGIVLVPGYLSAESVTAAVQECQALFEYTPHWGHQEDYSLGQSVRMERAEMDYTEFSVLSSAFARPALEAIVEGFFGTEYIFSRTIYAILDVIGSKTSVQQLHYDKMRHLKSFIYLTDVELANGPFHCVPGSHLIAREAQRESRSRNSDIFHHAGTVTSGERLAARSLSSGAYRKEIWYRPDRTVMPGP
jgi:Phytanoyl-CoA dioxygenase (PhyH)